MGCAVAFAALVRDYEAQRPTRFNAVVANAPLIKADSSPFPYSVAVAIGKLSVGGGLGASYAPSQGKSFEQGYGNGAFDGATTTSVERWLRSRDMCVKYREQSVGEDNHIGLCVGGISAQFAQEFFELYNDFSDFEAGAGRLSTPVHIQTAGPAAGTDGWVLNDETQKWCNDGLLRCTITNYAASRHNIWWERDAIRSPALAEADAFLQGHREHKVEQCPLPPPCGEWVY